MSGYRTKLRRRWADRRALRCYGSPGMAEMPKSVAGATYGAMASALADAARKINGVVSVPGSDGTPKSYPKITNAHALAIFQALRRGGGRSAGDAITVNEWSWQLAWSALGWKKWGDKFVMTKAQASAPYPTSLLGVYWDQVHDSAAALDASKTVVRPLPLDYSWAAYEQAARDAWEAMRRLEATKSASAPLPFPIPDKPPPPPITPPMPPFIGGFGNLWLWVIVGAYVLGRRKRR